MSSWLNGACAADPQAVLSKATLTACCNPGYARSVCALAATSETDSIRTMVRSDDGLYIEVAWSSERNHHPVAVGSIRVGRSLSAEAAAPLERQAHACAAQYLHQTGQI